MNKSLSALLIALGCILTSNQAFASDDPKTLPAPCYDQMKSGKKLDKVVILPGFDKAKGFKLGSVDYRAETMNSTVLEALKKSAAMAVRSESTYTLNLAIVKVTTKTFTGFGNVMGKVTVEGKITDANGDMVAAFKTAERAGSAGMGADDYQVACDKIVSAITKDLL